MREILFKGKRISDNTWVYGGIMKTFHPNFTHESSEAFALQKENCYCICANGKDYFVEQESIGQYTGLCAKNGKIFEGDILESRASENSEDWKRWLCIYHDGSFCFEREFGKRKKKYEQNLLCEDEIALYGLEVIGNIHDNPELLKEGAE